MSKQIIKPQKSKFLRYLKSYLPFWQRKKIGFYGNFGHGDLGDDASFIVARKLLNNSILPISKRCYAFNPHILRAFLIGGGGILRWESPYIPRRILTKKKWDFPVVLFSAGINCDYNKKFTEETKDKIKRLCNLCDYVTAKDKISQEFISSLGVSKIGILPDLELVLSEKSRGFNLEKEEFTVGIVLTPHSEFTPRIFEKMIDVFSQFTNYLTDRGNNVLFLPFEKGISENTKEKEFTQEIMRRLRNKNKVKILKEDLEPGEMLFAIKKYCNVMVCTRMHSAVFSTNAAIPFFCISYNLMHRGFLEMLNAQDLELSIFDNFSFESVKDKFEYVLKNYDSIKFKLIEKRDYLRGLIYKEVEFIKKILK